jgi:hypothetical protein
MTAGLTGLAAAIGQTNAGFARNEAVNLMTQLAQQRSAALPSLAQAMAAPDAYTWLAAHPDTNPMVQARVLQGATPLEVAQARSFAAESQLRGQQVGLRSNIGNLANAAYGGFAGLAGTGGTPGTAGAVAGRALAPPAAGDTNVDLGSGLAQNPDLMAGMPRDAAGFRQYLGRLQPWQKNLLRQQILAATGQAGVR